MEIEINEKQEGYESEFADYVTLAVPFIGFKHEASGIMNELTRRVAEDEGYGKYGRGYGCKKAVVVLDDLCRMYTEWVLRSVLRVAPQHGEYGGRLDGDDERLATRIRVVKERLETMMDVVEDDNFVCALIEKCGFSAAEGHERWEGLAISMYNTWRNIMKGHAAINTAIQYVE